MPRAENKTTAKVIGDMLYYDQGGLTVGSAEWFAWLNQEDHRLFYVEVSAGTFTARKEPRRWKGNSGKHYWYAYRHQGVKVHKAYLGQSEQLTSTRLYNVARQLAQQVQS
jgi:LuxR family maltose regulon positive regulatory protein